MVLIEEVPEVIEKKAVDIEKGIQLKEAGNFAFQSKDYSTAIEHYSNALQYIDDPTLSTLLHSNSSACYIQLNNWNKAINEATYAINYDNKNVKAYHRKATALKKNGQLNEAIENLKLGISTIGETSDDIDILPLTKLLTSYESNINKKKNASSSSSSTTSNNNSYKGFINKGNNKKGLFDDTMKTSNQSEGDRILSRLKESIGLANNSGGAHIDGIFQKLLDKKYFEKTVFPGLTLEQREECPKSLRELLDSPLYNKVLEEEAVPEAMLKAKSVMENVKKKGAALGDYMDEKTEATLWPQVVNEALARSIVSMVQKLHKRQHLALSRNPIFEAKTPMPDYYSQMKLFGGNVNNSSNNVDSENNASESNPPWEMEQLDDDILNKLVENGFGNLDEFMGDEWPSLILQDALRFTSSPIKKSSQKTGSTTQKAGILYPLPVPERVEEGLYGEMAWLPAPQALMQDFPALAEIVTNLHALPFELNRFFASPLAGGGGASGGGVPVLESLRLTRAMPSATALLRLKPGNFQPMRVDCDSGLLRKGNTPSGAASSSDTSQRQAMGNDSGYRITALYFLPRKTCDIPSNDLKDKESISNCGGELRLRNVFKDVTNSEKIIEKKDNKNGESVSLKETITGDNDGTVEFAPISDRLVLWRSDMVGNERKLFTGQGVQDLENAEDMYAVVFWMHGVEVEKK